MVQLRFFPWRGGKRFTSTSHPPENLRFKRSTPEILVFSCILWTHGGLSMIRANWKNFTPNWGAGPNWKTKKNLACTPFSSRTESTQTGLRSTSKGGPIWGGDLGTAWEEKIRRMTIVFGTERIAHNHMKTQQKKLCFRNFGIPL